MRTGIPPCVFRIRRDSARLLLAALAFIICSCPIQAQPLVKQVNLTYLTRRADVIVQGRVTEVLHESLPEYPNILTVKVTLSVEDMVRGPETGTYSFREVSLGLRSMENKRSYKVGQRLFLFLLSPSEYGLSSPIGMGQGRFYVASDPKGSPKVANENANEGVFTDVGREARKAGRTLTKSQSRVAATVRGPVQLNDFVSLVKTLTSLPRIQ